jgi:hypothetical protein
VAAVRKLHNEIQGKSLARILKSHDYEYKRRMAEQFFVTKKVYQGSTGL